MVRLAEHLWDWAKYRHTWQEHDVLLIDEISMVDCEMLEKIDYLARYLRGWRIELPEIPELAGQKKVHELHPDPFGGLQVISVGDFFQLAPVPNKSDANRPLASPQPHAGRNSMGHKDMQGSGPAMPSRRRASRKDEDSSDSGDDESTPKVPVIIAALPPEFVSQDAAERAAWSKPALAAVQAAWQSAAPAGAESSAAAAAAAGGPEYSVLGAVNGALLDMDKSPLQQAAEQAKQSWLQQQQQAPGTPQQRTSPRSQGSLKRRQQADDDGAVSAYSPVKHVKQGWLADQPAAPVPMAAVGGAFAIDPATGYGVGAQTGLRQHPEQQQQQTPSAMQQTIGVSFGTAAMHTQQPLSTPPHHLPSISQRMMQQLDTAQLRDLGIPAAKSRGELQRYTQQLKQQHPDVLQPLKGACQPVTGLGLQLLAQHFKLSDAPTAGASRSAAAACDGCAASGMEYKPATHSATLVSDTGAPPWPDVQDAAAASALRQQLRGLAVGAPSATLPFAQQQAVEQQQQQAEEIVVSDSQDDDYVSMSLVISQAEAAQQQAQASPGSIFAPRVNGLQEDAMVTVSAATAAIVGNDGTAPLGRVGSNCTAMSVNDGLCATPVAGGLSGRAADVAAAAAAPLPDEKDNCMLLLIDQPSAPVTSSVAVPPTKAAAGAAADATPTVPKQAVGDAQLLLASTAFADGEPELLPTQVWATTAAGIAAAPAPAREAMLQMQLSSSSNAAAAVVEATAAAADVDVVAGEKGAELGFADSYEQMMHDAQHGVLLPTQVLADSSGADLETAAATGGAAEGDCEVAQVSAPLTRTWQHLHQHMGNSNDVIDLCNSQCQVGSLQEQQQQQGALKQPCSSKDEVVYQCKIQSQADLNCVKMEPVADAAPVHAAAGHEGWQQQQQLGQQQQQWKVPPPPSPFTLAAAAAAGYQQTAEPGQPAAAAVVPAAAAGAGSSTVAAGSSSSTGSGHVPRVITAPGFDTSYYSRLLNESQVPPGPYTQTGQYGFRFVQRGQVYDTSGPVFGGSAAPVLGCNRVSSGSGPAALPGMSPLKPGITSSNTAAAPAAAAAGVCGASSSSGRPGVLQWRWPAQRASYCFKSPAWTAAGFKPVVLKQPFRQTEPELLRMLDEVRCGILTTEARKLLAWLARDLPEDDGIKPTNIFPRSKLVDKLNAAEYDKLAGPELITGCIDRCSIPGVLSPDVISKYMDGKVNAQHTLKLKPQAQVVLLWNLDVPGGLANGTRGVVEKFVSVKEYLRQEGLLPRNDPCQQQQQQHAGWGDFSYHQQRCPAQPCSGGHHHHQQQQQQQHGAWQQPQRSPTPYAPFQQQWQQHAATAPPPPQMQRLPRYREEQAPQQQQQQQPRPLVEPGCCGDPLCPCGMPSWSTTEPGPVLVRLPEAPDGIRIELPDWRVMPGWKRAQKQDDIVWINHTGAMQLPLVKFALPPRRANDPGAVPRKLIVGPQVWSQDSPVRVWNEEKERYVRDQAKLTHTQLQLRLAWALTVHRSQGMSISKLRVHLDQAFGAGMVYVALSRCTSLSGLQVVGRVKAPQCDEDVKRFYAFIQEEEKWLAAGQGSK